MSGLIGVNDLDLEFHHLGLAVSQPNKAIQFLGLLNYEIKEKVFDPLQGVNLIWCHSKDQPNIEIIYPQSLPNPIERLLNVNGELIYHICYAIDDRESTLGVLKAKGFRILPIVEPKPAVLFQNRKVSFYRIVGFGTIELLEK